MLDFISRNRMLVLVALTAFALTVPWLGVTFFHTKGEPREAIVAVSMLQSGNWVLPQSFGCDIPYKPPLLAWLISLCALLFNHGHVNEFVSRLPSALASVMLVAATWRMVRRARGTDRAWGTAIILLTSFEFFRASVACRTDMVLTACMLGGLYALVTMHGHRLRWLWAVLLLSGAVLAKGPVGVLLPCLICFIYDIVRRKNIFVSALKLTAVCLLSLLLPAWWYYEAWKIGGDAFLKLALEENIGRLTGTMSYDSHINPWWYNFVSLAAGMLPWTVPLAAAMCTRVFRKSIRHLRPRTAWQWLCLVATVTIVVFYCIPASKRSVYLLPCYPFLAYGVASVLHRVRSTAVAHVWSIILAVICILVPLALVGALVFAGDRLNLAPLHWWLWLPATLPFVVGLWWICTRRSHAMGTGDCLMLTYVLLLAYNAAYMPLALNARSDCPAAVAIAKTAGPDKPVYEIVTHDRLLRHYTVNFYLDDRVRHITDISRAPSGSFVITAPDSAVAGSLQADTVLKRSCDTRRPIVLVRVP